MKVLHLVGSQTSAYYSGVSTMYAPGCIDSLDTAVEDHIILLARLDGQWSIPNNLHEEEVMTCERFPLSEALKRLSEVYKPDIMQPHMFCYHGMVTCRYLADMLDIPLIGSPGHVMALTTDKWQSRAVVSSVGVQVPKGQLLQKGDDITMDPPFILKPCREDNSMGITLVRDASEVDDAVATAFQFDDLVICEEFIPLGRELRVGVVDAAEGSDDDLEFLPSVEYFLHDKALPIRTSADKITTAQGKLDFAPVNRQCPADLDDVLLRKLEVMTKKAHKALGCKHYSLYDVRVDPDGNPYFIEASPYCSFSPKSALVVMSCGDGSDRYYNSTDLFFRFAEKAMNEHQSKASLAASCACGLSCGGCGQNLGMRRRQDLTVNKDNSSTGDVAE